MKVLFNELPPQVQKAITIIRAHRKQVFLSGTVYTALMTAAFSLYFSSYPLKPVHFIFPAIGIPVPAYVLLRSHDLEFKEEYLRLFQALKDNRSSAALKPLFENNKSNYLKVNRDGSLEIGYKRPRKFLGLPIGRRHVVKPTAPKRIRDKWKASIEFRKKRVRRR